MPTLLHDIAVVSFLGTGATKDSQRANALQGIAVVSSRGNNEFPFIGTEL